MMQFHNSITQIIKEKMSPKLTLKVLEYGTFGLGIIYIACQRWQMDLVTKTLLGFLVILTWLFYLEYNFDKKTKRPTVMFVKYSIGSGLWCTLLLPLALLLSCANSFYPCSVSYMNITMLAWPLVITTISWVNYTVVQQFNGVSDIIILHFIPLALNPIIWFCCPVYINIFNHLEIADLIIASIIFHVAFWITANHLLFSSVKSFTLGEVILFAQGCAVFCFDTFINLKTKAWDFPGTGGAVEFAEVCNVGAGLFVITLLYIPQSRQPIGFFLMAAAIGLGFIIPFSSYVIGENSLVWLGNYISNSPIGLMLLIHVVDLSVVAILVSAYHTSDSSTIGRKYFHLLIGLAYLPALVYHIELVFLFSAVVLGIFIIFECIRVARFPHLGEWIQHCCITYVSKKSEGVLIVDHLHLLIGCSAPIWLFPNYQLEPSMAAYSGLISVVIGDSLAHLGGSLFGRHRWPDGNKTLEGTACSIVGQIIIYLIFMLFGYTTVPVWRYVIPVTLSSLLESFTTQLPGFIFTDKLGQGSYAVVYKAYASKGDRREVVAIKCVEKNSLNKSATENLLTEISILKKLKHDHIVQMLDFLWDDNYIYIIMEYCGGGDLSSFIKSRRNLPERVVRKFLQQLASALKYLRSANISHMDLKPQNILLSSPTNSVIKMADFGFAQYLTVHDDASALRGSPLYMAPEILLNQKYDARADLWSVGVILYECLFGRAPYSSSNFTELAAKIKNPKPIEIVYGVNISDECRDLLLRLLQRDPDKRISFDDFFNHLFVDLRHMPSPQSYKTAVELLTEAVSLDAKSQYSEAIRYYLDGLQHMMAAKSYDKNEERKEALGQKIVEYLNRAETLKAMLKPKPSNDSAQLQELVELSISSVPLSAALKVAKLAEHQISLEMYQIALEKFQLALGTLIPLLSEEPKGRRRDLLCCQVQKWLQQAETVKDFLAVGQVYSEIPEEKEDPTNKNALSESLKQQCSIQ
ncbi:Serine/threonine-protein kinase ulk3 [Chamberlinius hualienensis]